MLGWLVHLCIFRMKIILRHLRFKFQAQFILFFIQLSLGWLACHPRAFADCPLLCTSPLRSSCSLHLWLLLSNQPDFRGGFITIRGKVFIKIKKKPHRYAITQNSPMIFLHWLVLQHSASVWLTCELPLFFYAALLTADISTRISDSRPPVSFFFCGHFNHRMTGSVISIGTVMALQCL